MRGPDVNAASRPSACPFVAFDDDRDRRAEAPDARHRCFAVPNPEPRALAHQAAYCLTPNFPSCAFFMDWAARAAAAPSGGGMEYPPAGPGFGGYPGQPVQHESPGVFDPGGRPWAAPPPWVADPDLRATAPESPPPYGQGYGAEAYPAYVPPPQSPYAPASPVAPGSQAGYAPPAPGEAPEQLTALPEFEESELDRDYDLSGGLGRAAASYPLPAQPATIDAGYNPDPGILPVPSEAYPADEPMIDTGPLAPLAPLGRNAEPHQPPQANADDMPAFVLPPTAERPHAPSAPRPVPQAGAQQAPRPSEAVPPPGAQQAPRPSEAVAAPAYGPAGPEAWSHPGLPYGSMPADIDAAPPEPAQRSRLTGRPVGPSSPPRPPQARPPVKKRGDGEWSKPRRFEAYPTLGGRMRLGGISPVLVGAFVVAIAALLLFLLPGFLSGGPNTPVASRTPRVTASIVPTPTPEPTPQSYTVKGGDVLSTIAKTLGVTVDQIVCFNDLKNPDRLSIGQVLLIPPPDYVCPPKPTPTARPR
jgi:hypothetical protein